MIWVILAIEVVIVFGVTAPIASRMTFRSYRSMLEVSIPATYAVRNLKVPSSSEFGVGALNRAGTPYPVIVSIDASHLYFSPRHRSSPTLWGGSPSYAVPRIDVHSASVTNHTATFRFGGKAVVLSRYVGLDPGQVLALGPDQVAWSSAEATLHPHPTTTGRELARTFNWVRSATALILISASGLAAWESHIALALGLLVGTATFTGLIGRPLARVLLRTSNVAKRDRFRGSGFPIMIAVSSLPMFVIGAVGIVLGGQFAVAAFLGGLFLSSALSEVTLFSAATILGNRSGAEVSTEGTGSSQQ